MKERALRGNSAPKKEAAPALKTVELWCDACHAKWTEGCFAAWEKCPFVDCKGTLRAIPPPAPPQRPKYKKPDGFPLFEQP